MSSPVATPSSALSPRYRLTQKQQREALRETEAVRKKLEQQKAARAAAGRRKK
jgi:hypothetical protein